MQDCLQLTAEQQSEMIRLRAECLAKQGDNQAEWQQLCSAIAEASVLEQLLLLLNVSQVASGTLQKAFCLITSEKMAVCPCWRPLL